MLSNAYFLAKFRFDTAENEPAKNLQNFANFTLATMPFVALNREPVAARLRSAAHRFFGHFDGSLASYTSIFAPVLQYIR